MRPRRLTRACFAALDGAVPERHGARYFSPGRLVVNFTSEAALAVLVALRYLPADVSEAEDDLVLGWTEIASIPEQVPVGGDEARRRFVDDWLESSRSLMGAVPSTVLPEADIVLMNPRHRDAANVPPLVTRAFSFAQTLHTPRMLGKLG
jgi:RES domain-containing protein